MAAAEYYYGTQAVQTGENRPQHPYAAPQAQQQYPYSASSPQPSGYQQHHYGTPPPSYSSHPPPPAPPTSHPQQYPPPPGPPPTSNGTARPPTSAPYPQTPPPMKQQGYAPQPSGNGGYLGVPVQPIRSHSQPPRVRFADEEAIYDSDSSGRSYDSESDDSRRRHGSRRKHSRHRRDRSTSSDLDRSYDRDRGSERDRSHRSSKHRSSHHHKERRDRDTFLGAGVGGLVGDAIFPGLGTAAGLLLGGYGGRKYGRRERSESDSASGNGGVRERWAKGGWRGDGGWDEETATYRKGGAVR